MPTRTPSSLKPSQTLTTKVGLLQLLITTTTISLFMMTQFPICLSSPPSSSSAQAPCNSHTNDLNCSSTTTSPSDPSSSSSYKHVIVTGPPFTRGFSHGSQVKDKIHIGLGKYKKALGPWDECVKFVQTNYLGALKSYFPTGLEEMRGIAEGAGVTLEDIIILNARYDLFRWRRWLKTNSTNPNPKPPTVVVSTTTPIRSKVMAKTNLNKRRASCPCELRKDENEDDLQQQNNNKPTTILENLIHPTLFPIHHGNNGGHHDDDLDGLHHDHDESKVDSGTEDMEQEHEECTGAVALKSSTLHGHVLLGQNWDTNDFILDNDTAILLEVHPDPSEKIRPFVTLTEAGQLIRNGMNSGGLGIVGMSLWSSDEIYVQEPTKQPKGWIPVTLLRRMFLEAPTFSLGLAAILRTPRHVSGNMIIATGEDEALNIELTPTSYFVTQVPLEKEILSHSNHFKSPAFLAKDDIKEGSSGSSSLFRDRRVEKTLGTSWPKITEDSFQTAFKDHVGYPNSVCSHSVSKELSWTSVDSTKTTVASIIYNLSQRSLRICKGPPCSGTYKEYVFQFSSSQNEVY